MRRLVETAAATAAGASVIACGGSSGGPVPGYGVVDPMPSPARCVDIPPGQLAYYVGMYGTWQPDGALEIRVDLGWQIEPAAEIVGPITASAGDVQASATPSRSVVVVLKPPADAKAIEMTLGMTCAGRAESPRFQVDVSGARTPGSSAMVTAMVSP